MDAWCFTDHELDNPSACLGSDLFVADVNGKQVLVRRDEKVHPVRYKLPPGMLAQNDRDETAQTWRLVFCDPVTGRLIKLL